MEIFTLLEALEDILERSKTVPFTEKSIIEKRILELREAKMNKTKTKIAKKR